MQLVVHKICSLRLISFASSQMSVGLSFSCTVHIIGSGCIYLLVWCWSNTFCLLFGSEHV